MMFHFRALRYDWWISYNSGLGRWQIATGENPNDEVWGSYATPEQAASDIYDQATGNDQWDMAPPEKIPQRIADIHEWEADIPR